MVDNVVHWNRSQEEHFWLRPLTVCGLPITKDSRFLRTEEKAQVTCVDCLVRDIEEALERDPDEPTVQDRIRQLNEHAQAFGNTMQSMGKAAAKVADNITTALAQMDRIEALQLGEADADDSD